MKIGTREVGPGHPAFIIAECGSIAASIVLGMVSLLLRHATAAVGSEIEAPRYAVEHSMSVKAHCPDNQPPWRKKR